MKYVDYKISKEYRIESMNITVLRSQLIEMYESKGIDVLNLENFVNKRNYRTDYPTTKIKDRIIKFSPENYIFQAIVLLEDNNGNLQLLDGFRRLFRTDDINHLSNCNVFIFKKEDFTETELIYFLTTLNQPKFIGSNGSFIERGISLFFQYNYGIKINTFSQILYYYLTQAEYNDKDYSDINVSLVNDGDLVKETMIEDKFLNNLQFMFDLINNYPNLIYLNNIGGFIYHFTNDNNITLKFENIKFNESFNKLYKENKFGNSGVNELKNSAVIYNEFVNSVKMAYGFNANLTYTDSINEYNSLKRVITKNKYKAVDLGTGRVRDLFDVMKDTDQRPLFRCLLKPEKNNKSFVDNLYFDFKVTDINHYSSTLYENMTIKKFNVIRDNSLIAGIDEKYDSFIFNKGITINGNRYSLFTYFMGFDENEKVNIILHDRK